MGEPTLRHKYMEVKAEFDAQKKIAEEELGKKIACVIDQFQKETGFLITSIDLQLAHHRNFGVLDKVVVTDINLNTNFGS